MAVGLFGAALLYGDGIITPAISVLGAVEGLAVATPALSHWVAPMAFGIILALFAFQRHGHRPGGRGVRADHRRSGSSASRRWASTASLREPAVLAAINPWYAIDLLRPRRGHRASLILGSVVLVVTGGEALYADMGHFGRRPIRVAWFTVVLPALVLNYFGQGAYLLHDPVGGDATRSTPWCPSGRCIPMVVLATAAAVVASQALISGAFSLTRQAVQLGYCPRVTHRPHLEHRDRADLHPHGEQRALMIACLALVLGFRHLEQPGGRLRHRGHHDDGDHHHPASPWWPAKRWQWARWRSRR